MSLLRIQKPKTRKGKRALLELEPKVIENVKNALFLEGRKSSVTIKDVLKDLCTFKKPHCKSLTRNNDITPFDDQVPLETLLSKNDCHLFTFGSHSKKRPDNVIMGRVYDNQILDMIEFGVKNFKGLKEFKSEKIGIMSKPCLVFNGDKWKMSEELRRIKSLFVDMFHVEDVDSIRLQGIEHVISFTVVDDLTIMIRSYKILLKKSGLRTPRIELEEIGPSIDFTIRRTKIASKDLYKLAHKKPVELKVTKKKNVSRDALGLLIMKQLYFWLIICSFVMVVLNTEVETKLCPDCPGTVSNLSGCRFRTRVFVIFQKRKINQHSQIFYITMSLLRIQKPKTRKGKRALLELGPKVIENVKNALFLEGRKSSVTIKDVLKDLCTFKKPHCKSLTRNNDITPFDDQVPLETLLSKNDCHLFTFGSHSKKRPNNVIMGRVYDNQILDMIEFGVKNFKGLKEFKSEKIGIMSKPCLVFNGDKWKMSEELRRIKSLFVDMFHVEDVDSIRLQGIEHVISFTVVDDLTIMIRSYKILLKKSGLRTPRIELEEIGPSIDFTIRRTKIASKDLYKLAHKKPVELKVTKKKNVSRDALGNVNARVHIDKQVVGKLQTRKMKGLKKTPEEKKAARKLKKSAAKENGETA
ncbi:CLUMA_CG010660, isoform A [Clunio marinus]|uniref:Ribosome production factor 2 homolog n=1 Tax=Clunio marinus TaxID=568069 RepID=A0A1J1IAH9_9DIPT|nr:CLUMA_CG010660, isoform A [Clunio marinus]